MSAPPPPTKIPKSHPKVPPKSPNPPQRLVWSLLSTLVSPIPQSSTKITKSHKFVASLLSTLVSPYSLSRPLSLSTLVSSAAAAADPLMSSTGVIAST
ncbi:hypothetical protein Syun_002276 [Stephania yunnanensis]|uniref:Uncharacterized protein n=1 Tax=Stephania yunnanensis TaxID=152371 RepID=A0AAP0LFG8_9MAGN